MFCKKILKTDLGLHLLLTVVDSHRPTESGANKYFHFLGPGTARAAIQSKSEGRGRTDNSIPFRLRPVPRPWDYYPQSY